MPTILRAAGLSLLVLFCFELQLNAAPADAKGLAQQAQAILKTHCYRCHGQQGTNEGGFNYVADLAQLVRRKRVVPNEPGKSKLLKRILHADDPMPPAEEKVRPSKDEIALLQQWIEAGAPAAEAARPRSFVAPADMLQTIRADLDRAPPRERPFLRYLTLTHLHNAGLSREEMQSYRHGMSKLINSLSWGKAIVPPRTVDAEGTIVRIDLRDYQWNDKTWETLLARYPYGVLFESDSAKAIADATRCRLAFVRGDWFVAAASRPPLYHDLLQLPTSENELEKMLRVDTHENIRQERVARAGFNSSGVSRNNRLIERHESGNTVYWKSYDFAANTGRQNLFAHPQGPAGSPSDFLHDGGEIIFSLPNGLQAYLLADGKGQRIDKGPTAIVSDPRRPDRAVENGLSCMSCHTRGIIEKNDQVRGHVLKNASAFSPSAMETLLVLYPSAEQMTALMRADAKRFQDAVAKTGAPLSTTEPITALAARFEAELDLPLAAAEAGVRPADLLRALERYPHLAKQLGPLRLDGGTVQRQVLVDVFPDLADVLLRSTVHASRNVAAERLVRRGHALLASDRAGALQAFEQALQQEPDQAAAHAGKGDVLRLQGEFVRAVAAYSEAIRLDPRSAVFFNNRGLTFHRQGNHDKAVADFSAALRLEPRFAAAYHNRGVAYAAEGESELALADYSEALRLDPEVPLFYNNRGYAYFDREEYDKAIADYDQALRLDPKFAAARHNRGLAYLRKNRLPQALQDFNAAITLQPRMALAYFHRSLVYQKQGDARRAATDRKKALALDPNLDKE